jgi:hypothetical protein
VTGCLGIDNDNLNDPNLLGVSWAAVPRVDPGLLVAGLVEADLAAGDGDAVVVGIVPVLLRKAAVAGPDLGDEKTSDRLSVLASNDTAPRLRRTFISMPLAGSEWGTRSSCQ